MASLTRAKELPPDVFVRAVAGDRNAVRAVIEANCGYVRGMLFRMVGPSVDLDDLQQVVLLRLVRALPGLSCEGSFRSFVGSIVVNVVRDHRRRQKVRKVVSYRGGSGDLPEPAAENRQEARVDAGRRLEQCGRALKRLSEAQREAFVLRTVYGHSIAEIAAMMGSLRSTTRLRLYWGRKIFSRALAEEVWP